MTSQADGSAVEQPPIRLVHTIPWSDVSVPAIVRRQSRRLGARSRENINLTVRKGAPDRRDDDFLRLHADGRQHAGLLYCHQQKYSVGELLQLLLILGLGYEPREVAGRLEFL